MYNLFRTAKGLVLSGSLIAVSLFFSSASATASQTTPSDNQVDKVYDNYKVKQIQVVTRHGDRSPIVVWKGEAQNEFSLPKWYCDHEEHGVVECTPGQLTTRGKKQLFDLGSRLRNLYIDTLQALPSAYEKDEVFVRSTDITRTKQSAQNLLRGLYPPESRKEGEDIPITTLSIRNETLFTDFQCTRFKQLFEEFRNNYKHNDSASLENEEDTHLDINGVPVHYDLVRHGAQQEQHVGDFKQKLQKFIKNTEGHDYNLTEIFDLFTCIQNHHHHHDTHGSHDPKQQLAGFGVDEHEVDRLGRVSAYHWWFPYAASKEVARLGIGRAIGDIHKEMEASISNKNSHKFVLYSGHDSTIAPVLSALEVFDGHWPPYASNIVFELLESKEKPADHYVRMIYNQHVLKLPRCGSQAKENGTLCPYNKFEELAKIVTPVNYAEECKPREAHPDSLAHTNDFKKFQI